MNSKNYLAIVVLCITVLTSCKKEEPKIEPSPAPEYAALTIGNYWVYETYFTDGNGVVTLTNNYDSVYIATDTLINGKTYFKKVVQSKIFPSTSLFREENGVLVNQFGDALPTEAGVISTNQQVIGTDTLFTQVSTLLPYEDVTSVPAGFFKVRTIEHTYRIFESTQSGRRIRIKKAYTKYHPTKGDIRRSYFFISPKTTEFYEQVLVRTNVE